MELSYPSTEYTNFEMPSDDMDTHFTGYSSKLVKTRKNTVCIYCGSPILKGEWSVAAKGFIEKYEGNKPFRIHYCIDCVEEELDVCYGKRDRETCFKEWERRAEKNGWI